MKKANVTVLIPVYNESKTIAKIIETMKSSQYINEIICIDDASTDSTGEILKKIPNIEAITLKKNQGKASAIGKGIRKAKGDIILMIDGDLIGLNVGHVEQLITPLLQNDYDYSIGWILGGFVNSLTKPLTGERAYFKRDLTPLLDKMVNMGYGLELFLNYHFKEKKGKHVELKNMRQPFKEEKHTFGTAVRLNLHALADITSIILKSSNPPNFFVNAYLPFYFKENSKKVGITRSTIKKIQEKFIA
ncbi:hypothetical protein A2957_03375 [Candidatus Roizmanbacteria bacterium RIFCSPLOWO2_01_FULL_38_11]|uniref:Glycosyltransferase 2-like domain-containing protein n=1 Tax=Candidatus Roizmanbacteria bacterium RIFCSPLOWO2_01_FULL_38_11 TaxID=1802060 RepID=A0A1F7IP21_9BACT|nr:MAG: hypothetical protein A2957_03375 [Candidatus Roizmanbacteria bacterium RIFCSPLOWO2_01_FULL_38_11]